MGLDVTHRAVQVHPAAQRSIDHEQVVPARAGLAERERELDLEGRQPLLKRERELVVPGPSGDAHGVGGGARTDARGLPARP